MRVVFICDPIWDDEGWGKIKRSAIHLGKWAHSPFPVNVTMPKPNGVELCVGVAEMSQDQVTATVSAVEAAGKRIMFFTEQADFNRALDPSARQVLNAMLVSVGIAEARIGEHVDSIINRIMEAQERTHDLEGRLRKLEEHPDELSRLRGKLSTRPIRRG